MLDIQNRLLGDMIYLLRVWYSAFYGVFVHQKYVDALSLFSLEK